MLKSNGELWVGGCGRSSFFCNNWNWRPLPINIRDLVLISCFIKSVCVQLLWMGSSSYEYGARPSGTVPWRDSDPVSLTCLSHTLAVLPSWKYRLLKQKCLAFSAICWVRGLKARQDMVVLSTVVTGNSLLPSQNSFLCHNVLNHSIYLCSTKLDCSVGGLYTSWC